MAVFSENQAFQINDIFFTVGPSNIQVQKENLSYKWHALRQDSSTKIPTGHGGCVVSLQIPVPREDVLKLHRLIIQFKQNPFAFIENKYIREEIVPNWPAHQNMAFTLLNLTVENVVGNVGLFLLRIDMQWFNYFPFTHNFTFREEWETNWISTDDLSDEEKSLLHFLEEYKNITPDYTLDPFAPVDSQFKRVSKDIKAIKKSIYGYVTDQNYEIPWNLYDAKKHGTDIVDKLNSWQMFVFDLLPAPSGMQQARGVNNPRQSKIYVRYYNQLQAEALRDNFDIDLTDNQFAFDGDNGVWKAGRDYFYGLLSGTGGDTQGDSPTLPEYLEYKHYSNTVINKMLSHDKFILKFNVFELVELLPSFRKVLGADTNNLTSMIIAATAGALTIGGSGNGNVFYNPGNITSHYSPARKHPITGVIQPHHGVDYGHSLGTAIPAVATGTIKSSSVQGGYGNSVLILHDELSSSGKPIESFYAHLMSPGLPAGTRVQKNDHIGHVGNTGTSSGPHLHFEIRENGQAIDPLIWFSTLANTTTSQPLTSENPVTAAIPPGPHASTAAALLASMTIANTVAANNIAMASASSNDPATKEALSTAAVNLAATNKSTSENLTSAMTSVASTSIPSGIPETLPAWYDVLINAEIAPTSEDKEFFEHIIRLLQNGYQYYTKNPTVNGVFFKEIQIEIPGHGLFNTYDNSHNTIVTRIQGGLKHIIAALPIVGLEFPTHQHLGSTDAIYGFEFVTLDHDGNHDGVGSGGQLLEGARLTLQQNGRNLRPIFDSWMAECDNFITRLFTTYEYRGNSKKKIIISGTQAATMDGNPGASSIVLNCEETLSIVNEALVKSNTNTKSNKEDIYRKIIEKTSEIVKTWNSYTASSKRFQDDSSERRKPATFFTNGLSEIGIVAAEGAFDFATLEYFDVNNNSSDYTINGVNTYELDTTKVGASLSEEEHNKLAGYVNGLNSLQALASLILIETQMGGLASSNNHPTYDMYGFEQYISLSGYWLMVTYFREKWNLTFLETIMTITDEKFLLKLEALAATLIQISSTSNDTPFGAIDNSASILKRLAGLYSNVDASNPEHDGVDSTNSQFSVIFKQLIIGEYLVYLSKFVGISSTAFLTGTVDNFTSTLNNILPANPDGSPLLAEQFGLNKSLVSTLAILIQATDNPNSLPSSTPITKESWETNKSELIKDLLTEMLDYVIADPFLVKYFGIEKEVADMAYNIITDQSDALPDLKLPAHPFWNKTYLTPPDFYYYNYHEDGHYDLTGYQLYDNLSSKYTDGIYNFMSAWQKDGLKIDLSGSYTFGEVTEDTREFKFDFDGSNGVADPAFPSDVSPYALVPGDPKITKTATNKIKFNQPVSYGNSTSSSQLLGSNFDQDALYDPSQDSDLIERIKGVEFDFGRKEGYANEREEIAKLFNPSNLGLKNKAEDTAFTHFYGAEDLKQIVAESKKDLISQKFTMKRAWPTFRLYFIEEDQSEDFLINYDDFYHYNAIKDITIVRNRKIAGDVAIITMQNISGLLDGSKRATLRDVDYLSDNRTATGALTKTGEKVEKSRDPLLKDTVDEELFGSIVLRPGINVQLRTGYGNDPNNLEVKLSGRITDIVQSDNADLVEITIQGFGVELEQVPKGLDPNESNTYDLTHKLLGSLMLSPELIHFGRWEIGSVTQIGEMKDAGLDFRRYSSSEYYSKMNKIFLSHSSDYFKNLWTIMKPDGFVGPIEGIGNAFGAAYETGTFAPSLALEQSLVAIKELWKKFKDYVDIFKFIKKKKAYAMNTPQDDNIFAPDPKDYLLKPWWVKDIVGSLRSFKFTEAVRKGFHIYTSQKMTLDDLRYVLNNTTIWQVFYEMTLRHPGYAYSAIPYGKEFRYTMFYGVPSQRYWSKPAHPMFIEKVNKLREGLATPLDGNNPAPKDPPLASTIYDKLFSSGISLNPAEALLEKINTQKEILAEFGYATLRDALKDYLDALTLRFEPFRRYHMATSETDIISNNITVSEYNSANAVAVKYFNSSTQEEDNIKKNIREQEGISLVKIHDRIPDEEIRLTRIPDYPNIGGINLALRYGVGSLIYEAKNMYSGSILLVGNSRIKPWDIVFIVDKYSDICGPVEVEQVIEKISFETGYTTEIKPNAVVFANEISSFPIIEGLKAILAARTAEQDSLMPNFNTNNSLFNKVALTGSSVLKLTDINLGTNLLNGRSPREVAAFAGEEISKKAGIPNDLNVSSISQNVFMSGAWLIGGWFYLNKCLDNQSIIVYPLMKNGLPLVAAITSAQPETLWNITFGQIQSILNDTSKGTIEFISRWKLLGFGAVKAYAASGENERVANIAASGSTVAQ